MTFKRKYLYFFIIVLLVLDIAYSFCQYYNEPLDGDMAAIIVPSEWYEQVLSDPFGYNALVKGATYAGSNRFSIHFCMSTYFWYVPNFLQHFLYPVESVYFSTALLKISVHLLMLYLLAVYVSYFFKKNKNSCLMAALIVAPLFQTTLFNLYMGVIYASPTYTFFYSFSFALLLLFFLPFYKFILKAALFSTRGVSELDKKPQKVFNTKKGLGVYFGNWHG